MTAPCLLSLQSLMCSVILLVIIQRFSNFPNLMTRPMFSHCPGQLIPRKQLCSVLCIWVERVRGGSQRCWAGGGIPAIVSPERGGSGVVFKPGSMNPQQLFDEIKLTEARNSSVPPFFWLILKFISILHAIHVAWNRTHPSCFPAFYNCSNSRNILQIFGE